jgi:hypothetical protein
MGLHAKIRRVFRKADNENPRSGSRRKVSAPRANHRRLHFSADSTRYAPAMNDNNWIERDSHQAFRPVPGVFDLCLSSVTFLP